MMTPSRSQRLRRGKAPSEGFSLIELLVAMAVFLIIGSVSFTLFSKHQALLSEEQMTVGLNIGLRNALAQVQLDVVNAGNGLNVGGTNIPAWPVGVTIINSDPTPEQCFQAATFNEAGALISLPVYYAACFDQLNVVVVDPNTPPIHSCAATGCSLVTSAGATTTLNGQPPPPYTASQIYGNFHAGDKVLFVQSCSASGGHAAANSSGCMFTTAILAGVGAVNTSAPGCAAGCVNLTFNSTLVGGGNNASNDPLGMTTNAPAAVLTDQYGPGDWVVRLLPITYKVDATHVDSTNEPDPQLIRTQAGVANALMDQVIGFKVGAALWNNANTSTFQYNYNAASYSTGFDPPGTNAYQYNLIRSVRVSIIGRTEPNPTNPYRNLFDQGPYQIRGNSIIVDPRNLTMNND
jgi:prepilin-type N-terminal cleavage/methylation domain-containing protein